MNYEIETYLANSANHAGKWTVVHSGYGLAEPVTQFFSTEAKATAAKDALLVAINEEFPKFPERMLSVIQQSTLAEAKHYIRDLKHSRALDVSYFLICRVFYRLDPDNGRKRLNGQQQLTRPMKSKFAALRALRVLRRTYPTANIYGGLRRFERDEVSKRTEFLRDVVRAGERA